MTILLFAPILILTLYFLFRRFRNTRERLILFTGAVLMCGVLLAGYGNILLLPLFVGLPLGVLIFLSIDSKSTSLNETEMAAHLFL